MMRNTNNLYEPHMLMIDSGTFWRCKHGSTGFRSGMVWKGCWRCWLTNRAQKIWNKIQTVTQQPLPVKGEAPTLPNGNVR